MIICPNCNHQNPEGSVQCENCYTALPSTYPCSNCGALVQTDATFCGQCGYNLQSQKTNLAQTPNSLWSEDNLEDSFAEESPVSAVNSEIDRSPWDIEEEETAVNGLPNTDEQAFAFSEVETMQPRTSPFEEPDENLPSLEDLPPLEDLSDNAEETDDLESWMSSVTEEPSFNSELEIEEIPEFTDSEDLDTTAQFTQTKEPSWELPTEESSTEELGFEVTDNDEKIVFESNLSKEIDDLALEDTPELSLEDTPELSLEDTPELSLEEIDDLALEDTPELSLEDTPELDLEDTPELSLEDTPELSLEDTPELSLEDTPELSLEDTPAITTSGIPATSSTSFAAPISTDTSTRLQLQRAILFHTQTGNSIEIPADLAIIRLGKQNTQVPPDVDVSGFPNSEIVSRIHADIRVEGDTYFIEDRGSSNGTYINSSPLLTGNRHRLRTGDRISLGKGDLVTFLFQIN